MKPAYTRKYLYQQGRQNEYRYQRWASTLANRSNARHRSNIRAPPRPLPPDVCTQSVKICVARGAGSDSWLAGVSGCHIFVPAPHAPPPKGRGQKSKIVILPTTDRYLWIPIYNYLYQKFIYVSILNSRR